MADHGTLQWVAEVPLTNAVDNYSLGTGMSYGAVQWASDGSSTAPAPQTTGQIWPKGPAAV